MTFKQIKSIHRHSWVYENYVKFYITDDVQQCTFQQQMSRFFKLKTDDKSQMTSAKYFLRWLSLYESLK